MKLFRVTPNRMKLPNLLEFEDDEEGVRGFLFSFEALLFLFKGSNPGRPIGSSEGNDGELCCLLSLDLSTTAKKRHKPENVE